jgi:chorismate mutase
MSEGSRPRSSQTPPSLDEVRARLDALDGELLKLVDERAALARAVADAKAAAGDAGKFGLRPARETEILRRLLASPRAAATPSLVVRIWRELIGDSLSRQGPYHLAVWGGADWGRSVDVARLRFGAAPKMTQYGEPAQVIAAAKRPGGVGVLAIARDVAWWARLLAEPELQVFAGLPCLAAWGPLSALAIAKVEVAPTGADRTFWVTDAPGPAAKVVEALGREGAAGELLAEAAGLKLFQLMGYYQAGDERLARAPGTLSGVIGAAPAPLDV